MDSPELPNPAEIKPGWNNGVVELLDPVELGWRYIGELAIEAPDGND